MKWAGLKWGRALLFHGAKDKAGKEKKKTLFIGHTYSQSEQMLRFKSELIKYRLEKAENS